MKSNQDQSIAKRCRDGEKNIEACKNCHACWISIPWCYFSRACAVSITWVCHVFTFVVRWTYSGGIPSSLSTELLRRNATEELTDSQTVPKYQDDCHVLFAVMARKILRSAWIAGLVVKAFHAVTSVALVLFLYSAEFSISRLTCFVKVHHCFYRITFYWTGLWWSN